MNPWFQIDSSSLYNCSFEFENLCQPVSLSLSGLAFRRSEMVG